LILLCNSDLILGMLQQKTSAADESTAEVTTNQPKNYLYCLPLLLDEVERLLLLLELRVDVLFDDLEAELLLAVLLEVLCVGFETDL